MSTTSSSSWPAVRYAAAQSAAGKARRHPGHQVIEQAGMRGTIYAGSGGCRVVVVFHEPA
jgi:hypothetical protein